MPESAHEAGTEYLLPTMTTEEHLTELRRRLLISVGAWAAGSIVGWQAAPGWLRRFAADVGQPLIFVSPGEAFASYLKMAILTGLALAAPVILHQAWLFVLPALFPHEQRAARRFLIPSLALFVAGLAFAFLVVYPLALRFLLGFGGEQLQPAVSVSRFLTFFIAVTVPFGLAFQFPVALALLVELELTTVARLTQLRRIVYFLAFVVAAILTPPDVVSQVLLAVPVIVLYEAALWRLRKGAKGNG